MIDKKSYREVLGERLRTFRENRGLTMYAVARDGSIRIDQVKAVESGESNYTIDVFLGYIVGCNLYIFFAEKGENRAEKHDFDDMIGKIKANDPGI